MDWKESSWAHGNKGLALNLSSVNASCVFLGNLSFLSAHNWIKITTSTSYLERFMRMPHKTSDTY